MNSDLVQFVFKNLVVNNIQKDCVAVYFNNSGVESFYIYNFPKFDRVALISFCYDRCSVQIYYGDQDFDFVEYGLDDPVVILALASIGKL